MNSPKDEKETQKFQTWTSLSVLALDCWAPEDCLADSLVVCVIVSPLSTVLVEVCAGSSDGSPLTS